jgi:hypothetical protein
MLKLIPLSMNIEVKLMLITWNEGIALYQIYIVRTKEVSN